MSVCLQLWPSSSHSLWLPKNTHCHLSLSHNNHDVWNILNLCYSNDIIWTKERFEVILHLFSAVVHGLLVAFTKEPKLMNRSVHRVSIFILKMRSYSLTLKCNITKRLFCRSTTAVLTSHSEWLIKSKHMLLQQLGNLCLTIYNPHFPSSPPQTLYQQYKYFKRLEAGHKYLPF